MSTNEQRQAEHAQKLAALPLDERAAKIASEWGAPTTFVLEYLKLTERVAALEAKSKS